jgi:predicted dehydrogenase
MSYQRDFETKLRVGVVGVGSHCYRNILPAMHHLPVQLTAFCDINIQLARKTAPEFGVKHCYADLSEMLASQQLDAVFLCVGPKQHPVLATQALAAGVHVWMEKPPAIRAAEVEALIPLRNGRAVVVGFKKAHMPATRKARELFVDGSLGPIKSIFGIYPMSIPPNGKEILARREHQNWLANGCHPLAFFIAVGGPVAAVTTFRGIHGGGALVLQYANGAIGNLHLGAGGNNSQPMEQYAVFGESSYLTIDNVTRVVLHRGIPFDYGKTTSFSPAGTDSGSVVWEPQQMLGTLENQSAFTQGTFEEMHLFCQQALGTLPVGTSIADPTSLEFAAHLMHVYEAALLSDGDRITIPHSPNL